MRNDQVASRKDIRPGQTYAQIDSGFSKPSQWRVTRVYDDPWGVRHAEIMGLNDDSRRKTIACATLLEVRRYRLIEDAPVQDAAGRAPDSDRRLQDVAGPE